MDTSTTRKAWKARRLSFVVDGSLLVVPAAHAAEPSAATFKGKCLDLRNHCTAALAKASAYMKLGRCIADRGRLLQP
jgi:hypothetical protein